MFETPPRVESLFASVELWYSIPERAASVAYQLLIRNNKQFAIVAKESTLQIAKLLSPSNIQVSTRTGLVEIGFPGSSFISLAFGRRHRDEWLLPEYAKSHIEPPSIRSILSQTKSLACPPKALSAAEAAFSVLGSQMAACHEQFTVTSSLETMIPEPCQTSFDVAEFIWCSGAKDNQYVSFAALNFYPQHGYCA